MASNDNSTSTCTPKSAVEAERVQTEPRPQGCGQGLVTAKVMSQQTEAIRSKVGERLEPPRHVSPGCLDFPHGLVRWAMMQLRYGVNAGSMT